MFTIRGYGGFRYKPLEKVDSGGYEGVVTQVREDFLLNSELSGKTGVGLVV